MKTKFFLISLNFLISFSSFSKTYFLDPTNQRLTPTSKRTSHHHELKKENLELRLKVKKFRITQTSQGPKVTYWDVCEFNSNTDVIDLINGGLIQEKIFAICPTQWMNQEVHVVLSGMVYDNYAKDFQDEKEQLKRNFFSHLSVEGTSAFSLGDFNLNFSENIQFENMTSQLAVDPSYILLNDKNYREGFTASIRYRQKP